MQRTSLLEQVQSELILHIVIATVKFAHPHPSMQSAPASYCGRITFPPQTNCSRIFWDWTKTTSSKGLGCDIHGYMGDVQSGLN